MNKNDLIKYSQYFTGKIRVLLPCVCVCVGKCFRLANLVTKCTVNVVEIKCLILMASIMLAINDKDKREVQFRRKQ